ncbi:protein NRT1/ PTR FAMILY 3.1-like [Phragmites australis]|uniref:protein NRT1/ PTR FAMILY 3.1-like n=1 Tax=Phragmites australis TaxID=29695 RepID=UPI002D76BB7C|nr:protein NRT1/ PTR FAMILY 3.1-like [Phragmites australis]
MLSIWSASIILATACSHNGSFTIMQAERHITRNFTYKSDLELVSIILYDSVFVPLAPRVTGQPFGITYFQRMGIGLTIAILGVGSAALVETKRRGVAADHGRQYTIHGAVADAFASVGQMEFLYDQAPESMCSTAVALFWLCGSFGNHLSTVLVTVVQRATLGRGDWLRDNINRGRIDSYYWLITFIMVLNLGHHLLCFHYCTLKPLEVADEPGDRDKQSELPSPQKKVPGDGRRDGVRLIRG